MKKWSEKIVQLTKERVFVMLIGIIILFTILLLRFYQLQIIRYDEYSSNIRVGIERTIEVPSTRGLIFDRYGRQLATNKPIHVLKIDQQVKQTKESLNNVLLKVATVLELNGDEYIDNIPITNSPPFEYTTSKSSINQFMYNIPYNNEEHRKELLELSANELMDYLRKQYNIAKVSFEIDKQSGKKVKRGFTDEEARKIIALRTAMYPYTYKQYNLATIASNISDKSVAYIQENSDKFIGVSVGIDATRQYTEGEITGNLIGYTRTITDSLYEELQGQGYDKDDVVGHEGIEKSMEATLRGIDGKEVIEVDTLGKKVHTIEEGNAIQGDDIFLTIDIDLQKSVYKSIERRLSEALIVRLKGTRPKMKISAREMLISMIESSQLLISKMEKAPPSSKQNEIYQQLLQQYNQLDNMVKEEITLYDLFLQWISDENSTLTDKDLILALHEQGSLNLSPSLIEQIKLNNTGTGEQILIDQLQRGFLKPNQMAIDPFSATAVIVDVNTGEILSLVGYPSVDSNKLANEFNSYYPTLFDDRSMLWNRALMTTKAPGSIFKMVVAMAGLMEEVITPETIIYDTGVFTKAGEPHPVCWIHTNTGAGHGPVDLQKALEVSCNYYFYEVAHRLGLKYTEPYGSINVLEHYASLFGLGDLTGIELPEKEPNLSTPENLVDQAISSVLNKLKTMSEEKISTQVKEITKILEKGIYPSANPYATDVEGKIEYLSQYELKRTIEPILQEAIGKNLESKVKTAFQNIQGYLQLNIDDITENIVLNTMLDQTNRSLKSKANDQLKKHIEYMINETMQSISKDITENTDINDILQAYLEAYTVLYNKELNKNSDIQLVDNLRGKITNLLDQEDYYIKYLISKVQQNLIDTISTYILKDVDMEWNEGITVRTAIGQGNNAFSPIQMARYVVALANGKTVYDLKIIDGTYNSKTTQNYEEAPVKIHSSLNVPEEYISEIHEAMLKVTTGELGTSTNILGDLPIQIAGKTGTAEEANHEHSWFTGYAPFDNPEIVVVTSVYNEDGLGSFGSQIAKDVFSAYFKLNEKGEKSTLDYEFVE
ncbi:hypothetical protein AN639_01805 [Candidatus Epulonipiscium fishelsonii]|uniref:Uncharacterized protein n=1 Tax=Candidatus Epulonipiscium fishelsonii TaxID=77094 RepID=A0ACC8XEG0_9FIRM|nr:hypothetical protein AN639_01805 [Epulopiscium sp. SCG-B05WGA-EpuloA1]ONI41236.1 hypothetical protein AN396_03885 [Epulopiscium sp. SCG-B11WGA-EpuloA1]